MTDQEHITTTDNAISGGTKVTPSSKEAQSMQVQEARDIYAEFGSALNPDFESLAKVFRRLNIEEPVANSNFLHALSLTDLMFRHTDSSLQMVTGGYGDGFVECLKSSFVAMLQRIRKNGGTARVIVLNGDASTLRKWSDGEFKGVLSVTQSKMRDDGTIKHFIIGDDDMVRDEDPHRPLTPTSNANEVRAKVYFKNRSIARVFSSRFGAMWSALNPQ